MENIYPEGTIISSKENPSLKLIIRRYYKRIYYCSVADQPEQKELVYYERELIAPEK